MVSEKKCEISEISEISLLLMRSTAFHLVSPVINGMIILPTLPGIGERPVYLPASLHCATLRSEAVTFLISLVVCGRKAPKSICQQAPPGSFDSAP
jgi:hypothetical protein